eukprot:c19988_g5_i5.p1 GENE.c19988_g5_i5~~c19988_g5_i5.p1  ORF type:complete len:305 (+),score=48.64 c19988_g5_i5:634-1548(+)
MGASFPANNTLRIRPVLVTILRILMSPWLVFSGEWLIPRLSDVFVSWYYDLNKNISSTTSSLLIGESQFGLEQSLVRPRDTRHRRTCTELIFTSQIVVLALAPIVSQVMIHDKCLRLSRVFWVPCNDDGASLDVVAATSDPFLPDVPVLSQAEVCSITRIHVDSGLCCRGVIALASELNISKVLFQSLIVLLRALFIACRSNISKSARGGGRRRSGFVDRVLASPQEATLTRSIMSLLMVGFIYGGVAPLIWPVVLLGVNCTVLMWRVTRKHASIGLHKIVGWRAVWCGVGIQLALGFWFFSTA